MISNARHSGCKRSKAFSDLTQFRSCAALIVPKLGICCHVSPYCSDNNFRKTSSRFVVTMTLSSLSGLIAGSALKSSLKHQFYHFLCHDCSKIVCILYILYIIHTYNIHTIHTIHTRTLYISWLAFLQLSQFRRSTKLGIATGKKKAHRWLCFFQSVQQQHCLTTST